jgi:hypothetical protein
MNDVDLERITCQVEIEDHFHLHLRVLACFELCYLQQIATSLTLRNRPVRAQCCCAETFAQTSCRHAAAARA